MTDPLRVIVVDDEPLAREQLWTLLSRMPDLEVAGEARNGPEAIEMIERIDPDVVFMDIQMPRLSGVEVAKRLGGRVPPIIVFVTAHDSYALTAFDLAALDYVVKPFHEERLARAVERARIRLAEIRSGHSVERMQEALRRVLEDLPLRPADSSRGPADTERLLIRDAGRVTFVGVADIVHLEADDTYVKVHTRDKTHLMRTSLSSLEKKLDPARFVRTHRSHMVAIGQIREIRSRTHGDYLVRLEAGQQVPLARRRKGAIERLLRDAGD